MTVHDRACAVDHRRADFEAAVPARAALVAPRPTARSSSAWRRSSPTCARAATPRCWNTRTASTALQADVGRRAGDLAARTARPRFDAMPAGATRRRSRPRPRACAATTSASSRPAAASWSYRDADGTLLGQKVTPLDRVGIYVPGGKAAYPSSVLMNAMPAQVAGVGEIVMVVPTPRGERNAAGARRRPRGRRRPRVHHRRRAGGRRARLRHRHRAARSTRSPAPATPTWRAPSAACSARSAST